MNLTIVLYIVALFVFLVLFGISSRISYNRKSDLAAWWTEFAQNISSEMVGAFVTTLFIGIVITISQNVDSERTLKLQLILQMGSPDNTFSREAVRQLRAQGWIDDGSLKEKTFTSADLSGINLSGADLRSANFTAAMLIRTNLEDTLLQNVNFERADLSGANLNGSNLEKANLVRTVLENVSLENVNLRGADLRQSIMDTLTLRGADLSGANLEDLILSDFDMTDTVLRNTNLKNTILLGVDLSGINLEGADLEGARLGGVIFDAETILPDGTNWTRETDMSRFTDRNHSNFWDASSTDSQANH